MKSIVLSGINLFEGGPLSVYYDCLEEIIKLGLDKKYHIICFVHNEKLFEKYRGKFEIIELPKSKKNYIYRLYYEYFYFNKWSSNKDIFIWLSLHDITPRVHASKIFTYCHNPAPFFKGRNIIKYGLKNFFFMSLYYYIYRINVKSANAVIVQQDWIRKEFQRIYPVREVICAKPNIDLLHKFSNQSLNNSKPIFVFASYPRYFKNFEVICKASRLLKNYDFEIWLTIDGTENVYSKELLQQFNDDIHIRWIGIQSREELFEIYNRANYLIFPSKLETWGLPISEFKFTGKGIILADLPYAHETLGNYEKGVFFNPDSDTELAKIMLDLIKGEKVFKKTTIKEIQEPYANNWQELLEMLFLEW